MSECVVTVSGGRESVSNVNVVCRGYPCIQSMCACVCACVLWGSLSAMIPFIKSPSHHYVSLYFKMFAPPDFCVGTCHVYAHAALS